MLYTVINGFTTTPPLLVTTFEFKLKYDEKPLSVKYVPGVLFQNLVQLFLKVVIPDTLMMTCML